MRGNGIWLLVHAIYAIPMFGFFMMSGIYLASSRPGDPLPLSIELWADECRHDILFCERRRFFKGPFFWLGMWQGKVYRLELWTNRGKKRIAWIHLGAREEISRICNR